MNKKLIAVALAALPVAAMADVTLYGTLNGGFQNDKVTNGVSQNRVEDYTSLIGFKGGEDLGNGLKAIWQIESRIYVDGGDSANLGTRDTFIGLQGDFGKVRLGKLSNQLNDLGLVDPWAYRSAVGVKGANGLGTFTNSGDRLKNAIRYDSPNFYGFDGSIMWGAGENKSKDATGTKKASDILGIGLNWSYDAFGVHYAYQKEFNPGSQLDDGRKAASIHRLEATYSADNLFVALGYNKGTGYDWLDDFSGDGSYVVSGLTSAQRKVVSKQAALTVAYSFGAITPRFSYAKGWDQHDNVTGKIANSGYRQYVLGVDYALSKRTSTGISYGNAKYDKGTGVAINAANGNAANAVDTSVKTLGVHLTHNF
ncbi:porin [Paludibacterium paludis]|uniref:Major outer membrane protein P.IB n=1 Tax=Paludibacterium paludis TaxID=1225769 RepID=A0A918NZE9_9NEIS|nr:porin [Paludibacterium paludis]GGY08217.1 major outer membrane protein P.IB [Paludibacterium paludis]